MSRFNDFEDEDLFDFIINERNANTSLNYKNISYRLREELLHQDGEFDYVGSFDNWAKTIEEIKNKTGIDLTELKEQRTKSYKQQ